MSPKAWGILFVSAIVAVKLGQFGLSFVGRHERNFIHKMCGLLQTEMPLDLKMLQIFMEKEKTKLYSVSFNKPATLPPNYKNKIDQLELEKISELMFVAEGFFADKETLQINAESGIIKKVTCR
jgi:hypothetical protein